MIEDKEDYFDETPAEKPKKVKPPRQPRLKPDDPRYYDREESRWEHITPSPYRRGPILWIVGSALVVMLICIWGYNYLFSPVVQEASEYGYVDHIQREGSFFQTFEGTLLPYKAVMDTLRPYDEDFVFSTNDDHLAAKLRENQGSGKPVKVDYKVYRFNWPWRGNTKVIVTNVSDVDPYIILPPDRHPERVPLYRTAETADSLAAAPQ